MNHTAQNTAIINDSLLNQGELCEVCFEKDDEDLYIVFNALYRVTVGEVFQQGSENMIDDFDLNPMSMYSSQKREEEFKASQEKLQLFRSKVSTQALLELISSPRFDLLLREIFKSKYNRVQDTNCKHKELAMNFIRNFNLKNDENFENSDLHKKRSLENAEKLDLMYAKVRQLKSEIESYHNEIDDLSNRIIKKLLPNYSQLNNKRGQITADDEERDHSDDESSDTSESYTVKKSHANDGNGHVDSSTGISSEGGSYEITPNDKSERKHKKSKTATFKSKLPKKATDVLKNWFLNNIKNPYPSHEAKEMLSKMTGLTRKQIQNWFTNSRKRFLEPIKKKIGTHAEKDDALTLEKVQGIFSPECQSNDDESESVPAALPESSSLPSQTSTVQPSLKTASSFLPSFQNASENLPLRPTPLQRPTATTPVSQQQPTQPMLFPGAIPQTNLQAANNFMVVPWVVAQPMYPYRQNLPNLSNLLPLNSPQFMSLQQPGFPGGYSMLPGAPQFLNSPYMLPLQQSAMFPIQQQSMLNLNDLIKPQVQNGFSTINNNVYNINQPSNIGQTVYNNPDRMGLATNRPVQFENQLSVNDKSRLGDIYHQRPELSEQNYQGSKLVHKM